MHQTETIFKEKPERKVDIRAIPVMFTEKDSIMLRLQQYRLKQARSNASQGTGSFKSAVGD